MGRHRASDLDVITAQLTVRALEWRRAVHLEDREIEASAMTYIDWLLDKWLEITAEDVA